MMIVAAVGTVGSALIGHRIPGFTGFVDQATKRFRRISWYVPGPVHNHRLRDFRIRSPVGSGTTSKQLDNEKYARPIAYGGMLIECALAIVFLSARRLHLVRICSRRNHYSDRCICNRYLTNGSNHSIPCRLRTHNLLSARSDCICILPDFSGYSNTSGTIHVPGILAESRRGCCKEAQDSKPS